MQKTLEQMIAELDAKIPRDEIVARKGGGGMVLSYLPGWYVIDRLNKVLGQGGWNALTSDPIKVADTEQDGKYVVAYMVKVRLEARHLGAIFEDYGYGDGKDNHPGKAHESAIKEAVTDGIKRCAKNLGMSMGLALYSKDQENVDDGETEHAAAESNNGRAKAQAPRLVSSTVAPAKRGSDKAGAPAESKGEASSGAEAKADRDTINRMIVQLAKVADAKGIKKIPEIKAAWKAKFGTDDNKSLSDEQANEALNELKEMTA